jgi:polysaccharide biosynthesis protein PslG
MLRHHCLPMLRSLIGMLLVGLLAAPAPHVAAQSERCFPVTGSCIDERFRTYWEQNGGLAVFGYPITAPITGPTEVAGPQRLNQWFERAHFELHPEQAGTPYEIQLSLLGRQATLGRQDEPPFQPIAPFPDTADRRFFAETGHSLAGAFKPFWETRGGLAIFGYPITEEFQ